MVSPVRSICIVGGGTAGWLTSGIIAARHRTSSGPGLQITLVESESIGIVGVGEGTSAGVRTERRTQGKMDQNAPEKSRFDQQDQGSRSAEDLARYRG